MTYDGQLTFLKDAGNYSLSRTVVGSTSLL